MFLFLFAFKKLWLLSKRIVSEEWNPRCGGSEQAGGVGVCLGNDSFVTPEEFGYSKKQSAQCSHSTRNILGLGSHSESSLSGERWISGLVFTTGCWAGTGNVGLTGVPSVFEAEIHHWGCLWGDLTVTHILGQCWFLLGQSCPVTEQGTRREPLLLPSSSPALGAAGILPPLRSQGAFSSCRYQPWKIFGLWWAHF